VLGLPPRGEEEFTIDLVLGVGPLSIAFYKMALAEFVRLKKWLFVKLSTWKFRLRKVYLLGLVDLMSGNSEKEEKF